MNLYDQLYVSHYNLVKKGVFKMVQTISKVCHLEKIVEPFKMVYFMYIINWLVWKPVLKNR